MAIGNLLLPHLVFKLSVILANGISIKPSNTLLTIPRMENNPGRIKQAPVMVCHCADSLAPKATVFNESEK